MCVLCVCVSVCVHETMNLNQIWVKKNPILIYMKHLEYHMY